MRNRVVCGLSGLVVLSLVVVGCQADAGGRCTTDGECASGLVCNQFTMRCAELALICETDDDCTDEPGQVCGALHTCVAAAAGADVIEDVVTGRDVVIVRDLPQADFTTDVSFPECPVLPETMLRATTFVIGADGHPGHGLDIDGDATTCAPEGQCSEGVDNAAAILGQLANEFMTGAVTDYQLNVLFQPWPADADTCPFLLSSRTGSAVLSGEGEELTLDGFTIDQEGESGDCAPGARFEDGCVTGGTLEAGRYLDAEFPLALNVMGMVFRLPLHQARIVGIVGEDWDSASFLLAGWIRRSELMEAIDNVPDEQVPEGVNPAGVKTFINSLGALQEDLDTDGDESPDALSTAIVVELAPVSILGFTD